MIELNDDDGNRIHAFGERIVPASDNQKQNDNKRCVISTLHRKLLFMHLKDY